ncbi:MAG TPA: thiol reductant ABC exporter subunit CydD, partial [Beutenbergiaceae bacterium]|nr:thiol reductant ABC exporter subunit CydD [Beutenbergiaceae bacterium]
MSKPLDPRLVRRASSARRTIALTVVLSIATTASVVAIALTLARGLGDLVTGERVIAQLGGDLGLIGGLFLLRGLLQFGLTRVGHRGAREVIAELRSQVLRHMAGLGPRWAA